MALIRVDPTKLRSSATVMGSIAGDASELADRAISATAGAPSYEGQFGPAVHAIGAEAAGRMRALSLLLEERNEYLGRKAEAFEAADQAVVSTIGGIPFYIVPPWITFQIEIPQWLKDAIAFIVSMLPGGDLLDILPQLWNMLSGQEVDDLVLSLAVIGLLMDLGYIDPIPAEEVGNAGAALLKLIAKKIPKGPARDAIAKAFKAIIENTDKLPKFVDVFTKLVGRSNVLTALAEKHPELFAKLLKGSPDALERMLKHEDDTILRYLDEIAAKGPAGQDFFEALARNPDALEVALRHSPDVAKKLAGYGDEGIELVARYKDDMLEWLAQTADPAGDLAHRTTKALEAAKELKALGPSALDAPGPTEAKALVQEIGTAMTHGSGDRVVLGAWVDPKEWATRGRGYVGEALTNGGKYYGGPSALFEELGRDPKLAQAVNEQFLENQLKAGVPRIDFMGDARYTYAFAPHTSGRWLELNLLFSRAEKYGYEVVHTVDRSSWILSR